MGLKKEIKKTGKEIGREIKEVEQWMIERKKFFIKLSWIVFLIIFLIITSNYIFNLKA